MRAKSMVLILIALGCGLVASIGISQVLDRNSNQQSGNAVEMVPILVAMTDIDILEKFTAQNVKIEEWPKDRLPEGAITSFDEVDESLPKVRFFIGEPILDRKLMDKTEGSIDIPIGYRVVPVKISSETVTELVQPGDRIDILVFLPRSSDIPVPSTRTVLRDVRIYAVGSQIERIIDQQGQAMSAKTVSLIVEPAQVELLMLAGELGKLKLSLRGHDDTSDSDQDGSGVTNIYQLLNGASERADDRQPITEPTTQANAQDSLRDLLDRMGTADRPDNSSSNNEVTSTMTILTPDGVPVEYRWNSDNKLIGMVTQGVDDQTSPSDASVFPPTDRDDTEANDKASLETNSASNKPSN